MLAAILDIRSWMVRNQGHIFSENIHSYASHMIEASQYYEKKD
jgi:hypothetical protein